MIIATELDWREAIDAHKGERFLWIEPRFRELPDAPFIPIDRLRSLKIEHRKSGKDFLLGAKNASGIYPAEAHWLIPKGVGPSWLRKHLADLIAITDRFQFGPETETGNVFFHSGDLGDIVSALPSIRQLGGGKLVIGQQSGVGNREPMKGARFDALKPLLLAQSYITEVEYDDEPQHITHNIALFRHDPVWGQSLAHWQAKHLGIDNLNLEPWLEVGDFEKHGHVVINRSARYHNIFFPWGELLYRYRGKIVFVGLESEHKALEQETGAQFEYMHTPDLLVLAKFIAGARLCIMNQSLPFWLAAGLGVPLIQETHLGDPNSIIERSNAIYTATGPETRTLMLRLQRGLVTQLDEQLIK